MLRTMAFMIVYPLLYLPLFLLFVWPMVLGQVLGFGMLSLGMVLLWSIPFYFFIARRFMSWPWWNDARARVRAWDR